MQGVLFLTLNSACYKTRKAKGTGAPSSQANAVTLRFLWSFFIFFFFWGPRCQSSHSVRSLPKAQEVYKSEVHPKAGTQGQVSSIHSNSTASSGNVNICCIRTSTQGQLSLRIFASNGASPCIACCPKMLLLLCC